MICGAATEMLEMILKKNPSLKADMTECIFGFAPWKLVRSKYSSILIWRFKPRVALKYNSTPITGEEPTVRVIASPAEHHRNIT